MTETSTRQIHLLEGGRVLAEYGPMQLLISASIGTIPQVTECVRAAKQSFHYLESVALHKDSIFAPWPRVKGHIGDEIVDSMVSASRVVGDRDLTPMAAVAGAIADAVADFLYERGMTRVIVNNGGDVAIRIGRGQSVRIGVGPQEKLGGSPVTIVLGDCQRSWGVASSGLGGRSLTKGIAQLVTVVSAKAAHADAAATAIANATFVEDPCVSIVDAEDIDPNTDIAGTRVVSGVGEISEATVALGLKRGKKKADELIARGTIAGAFIVIKDRVALAGSFEELMSRGKIH